MEQVNFEEKMRAVNKVFLPSAPITKRDLFFGRMEQLDKVIDAIGEVGQHVVLYGDRGVGKTSLANIIAEDLNGIVISKVACNSTNSFKKSWESIFSRINLVKIKEGLGFTNLAKAPVLQLDLFQQKSEAQIDYSDILLVLEQIKEPVLFIFDEFDTVADKTTQIQFAQTIKALSDNAANVTVVIVGIADTVDELIGSHESLERCLKQIKLPKMSKDELRLIVKNGLASLGMNIDPDVEEDILKFSDGFPHYTHLLSKYSAKKALQNNSLVVLREHFDLAIDEAVSNAYESVRHSYQTATMTRKDDAIFKEVIFSCILVSEDENGSFKATDLEEPLSEVLGKEIKLQSYSYHLGKLCLDERGSMLQKIETGQTVRYKFRNPLLKAFVRLQFYKTHIQQKLNM